MTQFIISIIIIAVLFTIVKLFVPIDARVEKIIWLVIAAVVARWAVKYLVPMIA